ncbi:hypothetical protein GCM10010273_55670 [Streptomyces lavendulocolor]
MGAGGILAQWVEDAPGVHALDEVRRFRDTDPVTGEKTVRQWEADASAAATRQLAARDTAANGGRPAAVGRGAAGGGRRAAGHNAVWQPNGTTAARPAPGRGRQPGSGKPFAGRPSAQTPGGTRRSGCGRRDSERRRISGE